MIAGFFIQFNEQKLFFFDYYSEHLALSYFDQIRLEVMDAINKDSDEALKDLNRSKEVPEKLKEYFSN